jgi:uncharacterized membrane protein
MNRLILYTLLLPLWVSVFPNVSAPTPQPQAVVHAVLFYSPNCGHCQLVINNTLIPLLEQYGNQLSIVGIDVTQPSGGVLFSAALQQFNLETSGVPFLVIADTYLVGSIDIPESFPRLIEKYLAQGGLDWPAIPGLAETLAAAQSTQADSSPPATATASPQNTPAAVSSPQPTATPGIQLTSQGHDGQGSKFANDPLGNSLAVIVLTGMIVSVAGAALAWRSKPAAQKGNPAPANTWRWLIPLLCLVGIGVAGYLSYVETAQVEAVCGPVGDCNTVQQSEYARLFGILPIGILGIIGYILILLAWAGAHFGQGKLVAYTQMALLGLAAFGVLFSIYLTFLEPFVIGATCAWCLTSAIIMTILLWVSLAPARVAYYSLHKLNLKTLDIR